MPHSRKMGAFTLRQMTLITFGKLKRSPNQTPALQFVRLISIYRKVNSDASSGKKARPFNGWNCGGFPRSNNFALPNCLAESSLSLRPRYPDEGVNAALPYLLYPGVADSLVV